VTDPAPQPVPKVNDAYWFALSEDLVTKSLGSHEAAALKIQNLVLWLWGIYTTYAGLGAALAGKALPIWALILIALASAALIAVYWGTVWVQAPVAAEFEPRSPDDISCAFGEILSIRQRRFAITMAGSVAAAFLVTIAIVIASTVREDKSASPQLTAVVVDSKGSRELAILATVEKSSTARLRVDQVAGAKAGPSTERSVLATEAGVVQASVALEKGVTAVRVSVEWQGRDGSTWSLNREIKGAAEQKKI
jgi:hypothetical protein